MKKRITGRINRERGEYEVVGLEGEVVKAIPLDDARNDSKLAAAIERNGWEKL